MVIHKLICGLYFQIIPQSVCSRYGLAIGATMAPVVRVLVWICFPVAYPISKVHFILLSNVYTCIAENLCECSPFHTFATYLCNFQLLDLLLGDGHRALFRRAELKTLVNLHGNEVMIEYERTCLL